jgi:acyl-homoserine-lactone acylase
VLFRVFWENALGLPAGPWTHPFSLADPVGTPNGLKTASTGVQQAFGDALDAMQTVKLPFNVKLGTEQFTVRNGTKIPLPGGPADPDGEFNAVYLDVLRRQGNGPFLGSSYIQAVTWAPGRCAPRAATLLTYSESDDPASPHYSDQTELFSHRKWTTAYFCRAQVAKHALSTTVLRGG